MAGQPWTPEEESRLVELLAQEPRISYPQIARMIGRSVDAVSAKAEAMGIGRSSHTSWSPTEERHALGLGWSDFHQLYPDRTYHAYQNTRRRAQDTLSSNAELTDYTRLVNRIESDAVVCACVHVPETDPAMWSRLLAVGVRDRIPTLVVAGDIVTGDMFSKWLSNGQLPEWSWDKELESLRLHLASALNVFRQIVITPGNHVSNRITRVTGGHVRLKHIIAMAGLSDVERELITCTDVDFLDLVSGGERFKVGHASNYSKIGGNVPREYAEKYESHIIVGNGHISGMQVSKSGRWYAYEIGTMANPNLMGYANQSLNNYPRMHQSFVTVIGGAVRHYGPGLPMTDWVRELGA